MRGKDSCTQTHTHTRSGRQTETGEQKTVRVVRFGTFTVTSQRGGEADCYLTLSGGALVRVRARGGQTFLGGDTSCRWARRRVTMVTPSGAERSHYPPLFLHSCDDKEGEK